MEKFIISGYVDVPLAELEDFREALALHIELTRQEPGCIVFEVDEDLSHPGRFTVYEAFVDQAAFDLHQERVKASDWAEASKNIERHYTMDEE